MITYDGVKFYLSSAEIAKGGRRWKVVRSETIGHEMREKNHAVFQEEHLRGREKVC